MNTFKLLAATSCSALLCAGLAHGQSTPVPPAGGGATPGAPPPATTTTTLQEVIVTADKTGAQALQKAPEAVTVVTGAQLAAQGLRNIKDVAPYVPDVSFTQSLASAAIYIRGVGSNNVNAGSDPDVTTQVDGVYIARPSGQLTDFIDVASIEVLRGPQGTLYGRNAVGGVINVISQAPARTFQGRAELTAGNYGAVQGAGYITGPLFDHLYGSLAVNYFNHNDFFQNVVPGQDGLGAVNQGGVKGQLRWEPTGNIDATTRADLELVKDRPETYSNTIAAPPFPAPLTDSVVGSYRKVALDTPQTLKEQFDGVSEEINWHFAHGFNLKSITAFRNTIYKYTNDNDATEYLIQSFQNRESDRQYSQEFNLQYNDQKTRGVAGIYLFHDEDHQNVFVAVPGSITTPVARSLTNLASPQVDSTSGAAFAQGTYNITPQIALVAGGRYTAETKSLDQNYARNFLNPALNGASFPGFPVAFSLDHAYYAFTPKGGVNFQITPTALLYFSVTRGFKSGGFNYAASSPVGASFSPEKITSYEGGAKTEFFEHRLRVNVTAFYYDYTNLQVQQLLGPGNASIGNAATATIKGVELEVVAKPIPPLQLTGNISGLDPTYGTFNNASVPGGLVSFLTGRETCTAGPTGQTCVETASGRQLNAAPDFSGLAAADYTFRVRDFGVTAHVDYTFHGRSYFDPSNVAVLSQKSYGLLNAHLGFTSPDRTMGFEVFAKNLTNKGYFNTEAASGILPDGVAGDPRTYGVRVTYSF